jgi:iodotyrosine deiodinase
MSDDPRAVNVHAQNVHAKYSTDEKSFDDLPAPKYVPLGFARLPDSIMLERAESFYDSMNARRSVRFFSSDPVPKKLIELAILTAGTAPSGAHMEPWTFVAIDSTDLKARIRAAAETEELETYSRRLSDEWRGALAPLGTDHVKEHITDAAWVVVLFKQKYGINNGINSGGSHRKHYYVTESVGIAAGLFVAALHNMGLATLTHTPNPMQFLADILERPKNEEAMLLFPVGFPSHDAVVPDLQRKKLEEIVQWNQGE